MGMGGAYTAVSDDPAGMYYNPAGIVYSHSPNLSASVNAFRYSNKTFHNVFTGGSDWQRENSALVPNFFGVTQPFGKFTFGFSYAVPDASEENQNNTETNLKQIIKTYPTNDPNNPVNSNLSIEQFTSNLYQSTTVNKFGPSIAYQASDNFSIGVTVYIHKKNSLTIFNQYAKLEDGPTDGSDNPLDYTSPEDSTDTNNLTEVQSSYRSNDEYGITPIIGLIWSPTDRLALAATYSQNFTLFSEGYTQQSCLASYATETKGLCDKSKDYAQMSYGKTSNTHNEDPFEIKFGAAYFASNQLLLSGDLSYHSEITGKRSVINFAAGAEYYIDPEWALRTGFFSNISNALTPSASGTSSEQVDLYGGALSLTRFSKNSSISAGTNIQYGTGTSSAIAGGRLTDVTAFDMTFFLSTAYSY